MRLLLDTHTLIFAIDHREQLSRRVDDLLLDPEVERWVSPLSLAEIAVKIRTGKLRMPTGHAYYVEHLAALRAKILPLDLRHSLELMHLPMHHRDPFDRLLAAQARAEKLTLATRNPAFAHYPIECIW